MLCVEDNEVLECYKVFRVGLIYFTMMAELTDQDA